MVGQHVIKGRQLPETLAHALGRSDALAVAGAGASAARPAPRRARPRPRRFFRARPLAECLAGEWFSPLEKWTLAHAERPYPTAAEKVRLAALAGLQLGAVHTWFRNMRKRKYFHLERGVRPPADAFETQLLSLMPHAPQPPTHDTRFSPPAPAPAAPGLGALLEAVAAAQHVHAGAETRVVLAPVRGSFGVLLDRAPGAAVVAGFGDAGVERASGLRVGDVVVAADGRRLAGAPWEDVVRRIRARGRAGEPLELVVRPAGAAAPVTPPRAADGIPAAAAPRAAPGPPAPPTPPAVKRAAPTEDPAGPAPPAKRRGVRSLKHNT